MSKIRKQIAAAAIFILACTCALLVTSCNGKIEGVTIPITNDSTPLSLINHRISKTLIKDFRKAFNAEQDSLRRKNPDLFITESEAFNKKALLELLKDPNCIGLRIYYGVTKGEKSPKDLRMIIVGTDSKGNDLLIGNSAVATDVTQEGYGLEYGQCCQGQPVDQ